MFIDFSVRNYLSFRDEAVFSLLGANSVKEHDGTDDKQDNNTLLLPSGDRVLKFSAIYGANGSGKSNLIKSISHMREAVMHTAADDRIVDRLSQNLFQFDVKNQDTPAEFEINFIAEATAYRYGFQFFNGEIVSEWLYRKAAKALRETNCFRRKGQDVKVNTKVMKATRGLAAKTRTNALFLSVCAQFNVGEAQIVKNWFAGKLQIISGVQNDLFPLTAQIYAGNPQMREAIAKFIGLIDLGICNITARESETDGKVELYAEHDVYENQKKVGTRELSFSRESEGTKKIFALLGAWFETIQKGGLLIVDDFGEGLHTKLTLELVKIFQQTGNTSAQWVVATQDANLLRKEILRRDQIWLAAKNQYGTTDLYSLAQCKINQSVSVRNSASFGKNYLLGKYGAIPQFGDFESFRSEFLRGCRQRLENGQNDTNDDIAHQEKKECERLSDILPTK